jgi:hypothetical protein
MQANDTYGSDIVTLSGSVTHREKEYGSRGFQVMYQMQRRHFWYRGRHRFLLHALHRYLKVSPRRDDELRIIDLGGGCGGWLSYCLERGVLPVSELALGDSSFFALLAQRWFHRPQQPGLSEQEIRDEVKKTHRVPPSWLNSLLGMIFAPETPLGHDLPFSWGTSILGVFRKPDQVSVLAQCTADKERTPGPRP